MLVYFKENITNNKGHFMVTKGDKKGQFNRNILKNS